MGRFFPPENVICLLHAARMFAGNCGHGPFFNSGNILPGNQSFVEYLNDGTLDEDFINALDPSKFY